MLTLVVKKYLNNGLGPNVTPEDMLEYLEAVDQGMPFVAETGNKELPPVRQVLDAATQGKIVVLAHEKMFTSTETGKYDVTSAYGKFKALDELKAVRLLVKTAIESVNELDELSENARTCTIYLWLTCMSTLRPLSPFARIRSDLPIDCSVFERHA